MFGSTPLLIGPAVGEPMDFGLWFWPFPEGGDVTAYLEWRSQGSVWSVLNPSAVDDDD
ncbi:MAG TPA: hypothetical protein VFV09_02215 [Actinomycetota bacterium]|jgi:hypothetical protein|nr:hypothetical protein [Actinomycetota bacterium]